MHIQIPSDQELIIKSLAINAGFSSMDQYVLDLIERDNERAAVQFGLDQARRVQTSQAQTQGILQHALADERLTYLETGFIRAPQHSSR